MHFLKLTLIILFFASSSAAAPVGAVRAFGQVAGEIRRVKVESGDTLVSLGARVGVSWETLAATNNISDPNKIFPGQTIIVDTRRIVPSLLDEGLVINIPEASLYYFEGGNLVARYNVGLGSPDGPTPAGSFTILLKEFDQSWPYPASMQDERNTEKAIVLNKTSPGRENSLGSYWIQLSTWGYGIHGTPYKSAIGQFLGFGSIRIAHWDIKELFGRIKKGSRVEVAYMPVKIAVAPDGSVWAEAHRDVYGLREISVEDVMRVLKREGVADQIDVKALESGLRRRHGVAFKIREPIPTAATMHEGGKIIEESDQAVWRCLDCPPGKKRRVTFQIEARQAIDLQNSFPIEIRNDADQVVYRPQIVAEAAVHLNKGETRNFMWEVHDSEGQPLPPGSYSAIIRFNISVEESSGKSLSLPMWVGN